MNEGNQHLLETAAPAGQKSINRLPILAHVDWEVETQQHAGWKRAGRETERSMPMLTQSQGRTQSKVRLT